MTKREQLMRLNEVASLDRPDPMAAKLDALMQFMGVTVRETGHGVYEVVKPELPLGDYVHPIRFVPGMTVQNGLWYTDGEDIWEALQDGAAESLDAPWFDVIK